MYQMRITGKKYSEIAKEFKLSGERVRKILSNHYDRNEISRTLKGKLVKCEKCRKAFYNSYINKSGKYYCDRICNPIKNKEYFTERNRIRQKKYYGTEKGKQIISNINKKARLSAPEKSKARGYVAYSLKKGLIVKPSSCSYCGNKNSRIEGHHHDYSKPLEVIWLCTKCHKSLHTNNI